MVMIRKEKVREANLIEMERRLKEEEDLIASDPSVGAVPEVVANRMIGRIAAFFGTVRIIVLFLAPEYLSLSIAS